MSEFRQDWAPVTIDRRGRRGVGESKRAAVSRAVRSGVAVAQRKYASGENKSAHSAVGMDLRKVEAEDENFALKKAGRELGLAIQRARMAKEWKQKDLAQRINQKATVINQYESGKAIPRPQLISQMERALGVKLPRPGKKKKAKKQNKK